MNNLPNFFRRHKKSVLLGVGGLVIAGLLGVYGAWSVSIWSSYAAHYEGWQKAAQPSLDKALRSKTDVDRLAALRKVDGDLAVNNESICQVAPLVSWQFSSFSMLRAQETSCRQVVAQMNALKSRVNKLVKYLENEQQLVGVLSTSDLKKPEVAEGDFATQVTIWQSTVDAVKKLKVSTEFTPVKTEAEAKIGGIAEAWRALAAAHTIKDRSKYTEAVSNVTTAYQSVADINGVNEKQYQALMSDLQGAYHDTFKV